MNKSTDSEKGSEPCRVFYCLKEGRRWSQVKVDGIKGFADVAKLILAGRVVILPAAQRMNPAATSAPRLSYA